MRRSSWLQLVGVLLLVFGLMLTGCSASKENSQEKAKTGTETNAPGETASKSTDQTPVNLKYACKNSATHFMSLIDLDMFKKIESETNGKVKTTPYWAETLAKSSEWYTEITKGTADLMAILPGTGEERFTVYVASTNFFFDLINASDLRNASIELWAQKPEIMAEWKNANVVPLTRMSPGQSWLHSTNPVRSTKDFKGMTIRVADSTTEQLVKALGANPVKMTMGEAYSSLQKGIIDGIITGYDAMVAFKLGDVTKYSTALPYTQSYVVNKVMNVNIWNNLTPDNQKVIEENCRWWETEYITQRAKIDEKTTAYAKENKHELIKLPQAEEQIVSGILSENVKKSAEKANAMEIYNTAREIAKKYQK